LSRLLRHDWPGNVRELFNALERMVLLGGNESSPADGLRFLPDRERIPAKLATQGDTPTAASADQTPLAPVVPLSEVERRHILKSLELCGGNLTKTSQALDISLSTLQRRLKMYGDIGSIRPTGHIDRSS